MGSSKVLGRGSTMLCVVLTVVLSVHMGSSETSLPRCRDSVCAEDPHCVHTQARAECWNANSTTVSCRCCENCINEGEYITQDCAQRILACNPWHCRPVRCAYGTYVPHCDCCRKCLPKECKGVHDRNWPNCGLLCIACPTGTTSFFCPKTCCPVCIKE